MDVTIKVEYHGVYAHKTGNQTEVLLVNEDIKEAYRYIIEYLKEKHGLEPPFILMVGNMHIIGAVKKGTLLKDGDTFKLFPFMSGG